MGSPRRRHPIARHGQLRSPSAWGQLLKLVSIGLSVLLVSGAAVAAYVVYDFTSAVTTNAVELEGQKPLPPSIDEFEGGFNFVLAGVDTCEPEYAHLFPKRCDGPDANGTLNDVTLLVHVSDEPRRITVVSFPRDMMIPIPRCEDAEGNIRSAMSKQQLNVAYSDAGLSCVVKTVSELTGQEVQFAASVTFGGVIEITDAIGGVDVCLATPIRDRNTGLDLPAGNHTVSGITALQFLRTRYGVGDGSDLGRISNQQQYMSNLAKKLISSDTLGNIPVVLRLATTAIDNLETSTSLADPVKIVQIALALKSVPFEDIVFLQYPTAPDPNNANRVVPNQSAAATMWDAINENAQLQITHENTASDGVVVTDPGTTATVEPDPAAMPDHVVALPDTVKGTSAAQTTCSNGRQR